MLKETEFTLNRLIKERARLKDENERRHPVFKTDRELNNKIGALTRKIRDTKKLVELHKGLDEIRKNHISDEVRSWM